MARRIFQARWNCQKFLLMISSIMAMSGARNVMASLRYGNSWRGVAFVDKWRCSRQCCHAGNVLSLCQASSRNNAAYHSTSIHENVISSPKSATVKKVQAILSKRKKRAEYRQTVVEGPRMVFDLLQNPKTESLVRQVLISTEDFTEKYKDRLQQLPMSVSPRIQLVTPDILNSCTDTVTPQGIVALVDIPEFSPADEKHVSDLKAPLYLVLDGVSDPGNVGTLCRSSYAVGVAGVLLVGECCDVWNPKAVRSAMGASFQLPFLEAASWDEAVETMTQEWNVKQIYAATMIEDDDDSPDGSQSKSRPHYDVDWLAQPSALVIGSEGNGLSTDVRQALVGGKPLETGNTACQIGAVHIPMQAGIESLNAAICGSVIMFEYARQCNQLAK